MNTIIIVNVEGNFYFALFIEYFCIALQHNPSAARHKHYWKVLKAENYKKINLNLSTEEAFWKSIFDIYWYSLPPAHRLTRTIGADTWNKAIFFSRFYKNGRKAAIGNKKVTKISLKILKTASKIV